MSSHNVSPRRRSICIAGALSPVAAVLPQTVRAQARLPVEDFFKPSNIRGLSLAPGGKYIAGIRQVNGRANATVVDVATKKSLIVTNFRDADVTSLRWVNDNRLMFSLTDTERGSGDQIGGGLSVVARAGTNFRSLVERTVLTGGGRQL